MAPGAGGRPRSVSSVIPAIRHCLHLRRRLPPCSEQHPQNHRQSLCPLLLLLLLLPLRAGAGAVLYRPIPPATRSGCCWRGGSSRTPLEVAAAAGRSPSAICLASRACRKQKPRVHRIQQWNTRCHTFKHKPEDSDRKRRRFLQKIYTTRRRLTRFGVL